jgi:hypothetical protein
MQKISAKPGFRKGFRSGVSLIISIVLVSIVLLFAMAVSNLVVNSLRSSANVNRANEAFYAAEGALESGLMANQQQGAGYTTGDNPVLYDNCQTGQQCPTVPTARVKIQGQVPVSKMIDNQFIIPTPGTGTSGQDCNPLKAVLTPFSYSYNPMNDPHYTGAVTVEDVPALDHPCNWNKIKVGETIAIPLYVTTTSADANCTAYPPDQTVTYVCNPTNLGLSALKIKIRTPCSNGADMCESMYRFDLNTTPDQTQFKGDDPIVSWQIVGTDATGSESYTLQPRIDYEINPIPRWPPLSSVIAESKINSAKTLSDFMVINEMKTGIENDNSTFNSKFGTIKNFLMNLGTWSSRTIMKPVLKMTVIHSLESSTRNQVPYLEYQIVMNVSANPPATPADSAQTITAEGLSGTFKQVLEVKQPQETGLLEYVIQQ